MSGLRVIVTGLIGSIPMAGLTAHYLQYVTGLRKLGHDVMYLEDTGTWPYDLVTDSMIDDPRPGLHHLSQVMERYGGGAVWRLVDHRGEAHGIAEASYRRFVEDADVFINVTGAGILREELLAVPIRVYLDTDPGFVQMRAASDSTQDRHHLALHNRHASFGCNIGSAGCGVPTLGFSWIPTRQPIDLDLWPVAPRPGPGAPFTTILKWQTYDPVEFHGRRYGLKDREFIRFSDVPRMTGAPFLLAQTGEPPVADLGARGWRTVPGREVSSSLADYRSFIAMSRAEWGVAKNAYVELKTGWFGDRSASYLATGRPTVVQSTGFEAWLPAGCGVLGFRTIDEVVRAVTNVTESYQEHCEAARQIAVDLFAAERVLDRLLDAVGAS